MAQKTIGRYEIRDQLGEGGMGTVYLAYDPKLEREVALKVLQPQLYMQEPDFSVRFEREAKAVASLEHGSIVSLYDFGEEGEWLYYVMRVMKGGTLKKQIARGPLSLDETLTILRRIGGALDKAHSHGIVHRDIKPGNILFDEDGDAYLSDFGIVKMEDSSGLRTRTGQIFGTPQYMSPEQLNGKDIDGRSDIYSLGVVLYEMLSGSKPYDDESDSQVITMHLRDPVPNIAEANPNLPSSLQTVIEKAMAKDPAKRYASASQLTQAVSVIAAAQFAPPLEPEPVDAGAQSGRLSRWVYVLVVLALILFMVIAGLAVAKYVGPQPGDGDSAASEGEGQDGTFRGTEAGTIAEAAAPEAIAVTNEAAIAAAIAATVAADPEIDQGTSEAAIATAVAATSVAKSETTAATDEAASAIAVTAANSAAELEVIAAANKTATAAAAAATAVASATNAAELESRCISDSTWTPSGAGSLHTDNNNCWDLSSWGIEIQDGDFIIDAARPNSEEVNGLFAPIDGDVTIAFDVRVDRLTSPGDDILTNVSIGILPSHLPQNFGHIYYQQESPQAGYPVFVKHKERGGFDQYMTKGGEYITYPLGTVDQFRLVLVGDELNIFRNGSKVAGPINIDFTDRLFWIGYRLPVDGAIKATISNLIIEE